MTAGTVDLHCHILPALDDGALDMADAVGMARQAQRDGIDLVCATPHLRHDHDVRLDELPERCAAVNVELERAGVRVRVTPGAEVAETAVEALTRAEIEACTLGRGGRWILLEPAPGPLGDPTLAGVRKLQRRGFGVVLAHPERHVSADLPERLRALADAGALIQLTAAFVADAVGGALLEQRLVHVLGSDSHSSRGGRPLALGAGFERIADVPALAPHLEWIARTAPRAIVAGEPLSPPF